MGKVWDHQISFETRSSIGENLSCVFLILISIRNAFSSRTELSVFFAFNQMSEFAVIGGFGHVFSPQGLCVFYNFHLSGFASQLVSLRPFESHVASSNLFNAEQNSFGVAGMTDCRYRKTTNLQRSIIFQTQVPGTLTHPPTPKKWKRDGSRAYVFVCYFIWFYVGVQHVFLSVDVFLGCYFSVFLPKSVHGFLV